MPEDRITVPMQSGPVSLGPPLDLEQTFARMTQLLQAAAFSLQMQDAVGARAIAISAKALYAYAQAKWAASSAELLSLQLVLQLICMFEPLTRSAQCQLEGRYSEALNEIDNALKVNDEAIKTLTDYGKNPDYDPEIVTSLNSMLGIFPVMLKGTKASINADMMVYNGMTPAHGSGYVAFLEQAIAAFKGADDLPPSDQPLFLVLSAFCSQTAERLRARADFFRSFPFTEPLPTGKNVFIVHGQDEAKKLELKDFLSSLGLTPVILHQQDGLGKTIIEKFEYYAPQASFAFVLMTPDDKSQSHDSDSVESKWRARQNVILELGWFMAKIGRRRVVLLYKGELEIPSDILGIVYYHFTNSIKEVGEDIRQILKTAGMIT